MIVLDTHALLWWANGDGRLSARAAETITSERRQDGGCILISAISAWEIAMLVRSGRLDLTTDVGRWLETVAEVPQVEFVPVDNELAMHSVFLPGEFHRDPADRLIVATARREPAPLVTADAKIHGYPHVAAVW